jgi:hypothetical protein
MFVPAKGLLYLDSFFVFCGLLMGLVAGVLLRRFIPSRKMTSLVDVGIAAMASILAISTCAWRSAYNQWSFDQLMTNQLWATVVSSLVSVVLWRVVAHTIRRSS